MFRFFAAALTMLATPSAASAADLCEAIALRDVSPTSGGDYVVTEGRTIGAVTQFVKGRYDEGYFCTHGGGCYPRTVSLNGEVDVEAVKLTNCEVGSVISQDEEEVVYSVDVVRSMNSPSDLRFDDIENTLIDFGMGMAPADNAARHYVENPSGECAKLVRSALEGNPDSRNALVNGPPEICIWEY